MRANQCSRPRYKTAGRRNETPIVPAIMIANPAAYSRYGCLKCVLASRMALPQKMMPTKMMRGRKKYGEGSRNIRICMAE